MKINDREEIKQLVIGSTYVVFTHFVTIYDGCVALMKNESMSATLYQEDAKEFIKLMESTNDTSN